MADPQRVEDDLDLVARSNAAPSIAPGELADELKPLIDGLDLGRNVEELREHGYTIVRDIAPPELMDELREAIRSLLGADLGFATSTVANGGPDMDSFHKMTVKARR